CTASFKPLPALKRTVVEAGIVISSPVRGLRPVPALRSAVWKVPKPTNRTSSFFFRAPSIAPNTASTTSDALVRGRSVWSATAAMRSILFTGSFPLDRVMQKNRRVPEGSRWGGGTLIGGILPRQCRRWSENSDQRLHWAYHQCGNEAVG